MAAKGFRSWYIGHISIIFAFIRKLDAQLIISGAIMIGNIKQHLHKYKKTLMFIKKNKTNNLQNILPRKRK